jgi:hypothetical protein
MAAHPQLQAQAHVWGAEVVHATHQVDEWLQRLRVTDQGSTAPHQDCQTRAESGIQSLDETGVQLGSAVAFCHSLKIEKSKPGSSRARPRIYFQSIRLLTASAACRSDKSSKYYTIVIRASLPGLSDG